MKQRQSLLKLALAHYPNECARCGDTEGLEADHIIPRSAHADKEHADRIDNIRLLCRPCHRLMTNAYRRSRMDQVGLDGSYTKGTFPTTGHKQKRAGSRSRFAGRQTGW